MKLHCLPILLSIGLIAPTGKAEVPATQAAEERADLLLPRVRWINFPNDIESVAIDRKGRPWFISKTPVGTDLLKREVERSEDLAAPWVHHCRIALFDSKGRIWLTPQAGLLLGYDPKDKSWIELAAEGMAPGIEGVHHPAHALIGPVIEDSQGRIFAADLVGCHCYDQGKWSYQTLSEADESQTFIPPRERGSRIGLTCDDHARVYAWSIGARPDNIRGYWVHDANGWDHHLVAAGSPPGKLIAVIPLKDNRIVIFPNGSPASIVRVGPAPDEPADLFNKDVELLGDPVYATRLEAQRRLIARGWSAIPKLKEKLTGFLPPEVRTRITRIIRSVEEAPKKSQIDGRELVLSRAVFQVGIGEAFIWGTSASDDPNNPPQVLVWRLTSDGRLLPAPDELAKTYPSGGLVGDADGRMFVAGQSLLMLKEGKSTPLTDPLDGPIDHLFGMDKAGRIFLRSRGNVIAVDPSAPETRKTLATAEFDVPMTAACLSSDGKMYVQFNDPGHGFLSRFQNGKWTELPAPEKEPDPGLFRLQPLRDGEMILQPKSGGKTYLLRGDRWTTFRDMEDLIQSRADLLMKQLDNSLAGQPAGLNIRIDARKAIWCLDRQRLSVWSDGRWIRDATGSLPLSICEPAFGGRLMLLVDQRGSAFLAHLSSGALVINPYPAANSELARFVATEGFIEVDSLGRLFFLRSDFRFLMFNHEGFQVLDTVGRPRCEDAQHRVWFVDGNSNKLRIMSREGAFTEYFDPAISNQSYVAEDTDHSFWVTTDRGLIHLAYPPESPVKLIEPPYDRGVPHGATNFIRIDSDRNLWLPTRHKLHRIQLP